MFGRNNQQEEGISYFTVWDSKARCYVEPFPAPNKEVIMRDFLNAFRSPEAVNKNRYYINAEDFQLFRIGSFDTKTGEFTPSKPEHIANMHEIKALADLDKQKGALLPT